MIDLMGGQRRVERELDVCCERCKLQHGELAGSRGTMQDNVADMGNSVGDVLKEVRVEDA